MDKKYDALNIYLAMCYYKLEFFDIALDLVNHYLSIHNDSIIANNLKAAIEYSSTGNDKLAKEIILNLQNFSKNSNIIDDNDLLQHNLAVFDNEPDSKYNKLKIFSNLLDIIPEARQNTRSKTKFNNILFTQRLSKSSPFLNKRHATNNNKGLYIKSSGPLHFRPAR